MAFTRRQKVLFQHCDPAGIVFYPRYFEMMNATVEEWFERKLGHSFADLHGVLGGGVPTASLQAHFAAPSLLGDELEIVLLLTRLGRTSAGLAYEARCGDALRMNMTSTLVYVGAADGRPQPWPEALREALEAELES